MIRLGTHGREWIMKKAGMSYNGCPECKAQIFETHQGKPQNNKTMYWFDCECMKCDCEWTVEYREKIEHVD